jgi:hypothetical protein
LDFELFEKEKKPTEKDSILVFSVRKRIPLGIKTRFPEINEQSLRSVQEFETFGMLFKQKIFLKIAENTTTKPDAQKGLYISLDGKKCATTGGITGLGFGECAGANVSNTNKAIPYKFNIQIEP